MNDESPLKAPAHALGHGPELSRFDWSDPLRLEGQLTEDERMLRDAAQAFAQDRLAPRVKDAYHEEHADEAIFREMGEAGLLGVTIPEEHGGLGAGYVSYGLVAREVERVDSGYRSMMSVQSSLVMYPIHAYGSPDHHARYLPRLASGELIGCFGLTEPDAGSDPGGMRTTARKTDGGYRLSGTKTWISNAPIADVFVVWAKSEAHGGKIRGFVLEKGTKGLSAPKIGGKLSLRASVTGQIVMEDVRCPKPPSSRRGGAQGSLRLPQPRALRDLLGRDGRRRGLLAHRPPVWPRPQAVRPPPRPDPALPAQARRHADRDRAGPPGLPRARAA
jgi:glutaryl-CoA dehydrogenase